MATVYLAHDLKHDRKVAIKVLRPELAATIGADRFLSEIHTVAALSHPNILPLFDSGAASHPGHGEGSLLYYVMPFIEGETLRGRMNREKVLPLDEAVAAHPRDRRRTRLRPFPRRHPSRHQAGEHPAPDRATPSSPISASRGP